MLKYLKSMVKPALYFQAGLLQGNSEGKIKIRF
jgi:hypothetical protein